MTMNSEFASMVRDLPDFDHHKEVAVITDSESGLHCIIAVHNTHRGPGVGGCRLWQYDNQVDAITDVLRLSQGMTYKNAMADLPFGGGKAVILAPDFGKVTRSDMMKAFGKAIQTFNGDYCTAEDVGTTCEDMADIGSQTKHIFGLAHTSGDPSPFTAYGTFLGIKEAVKHRLHSDSLKGIRIAVQGLGHVGYSLCSQLHQAGAILTVSDIREAVVAQAQEEFSATVVAVDDIYDVDADVYAPCALGASINPQTLDRLTVSIIAGAANNQLSEESLANDLKDRNILYTPDYVINAGGIVNIACENGDYNPENARAEVAKVGSRLAQIFKIAEEKNQTTIRVANDITQKKFEHCYESKIHSASLKDTLSV